MKVLVATELSRMITLVQNNKLNAMDRFEIHSFVPLQENMF